MNRVLFYGSVRSSLFDGALTQEQVGGIDAILAALDAEGVLDQEERAYVLATAYHETGRKMQPVREIGQGKGRKYGIADKVTGQTYYGRGHVQLTWKENYAKFGKLLDLGLVENPDLALDPVTSARILVKGMKDGMFSPKYGPLAKYLGSAENWLGARGTVNGSDKAAAIAAIARRFDTALERADVPPAPVFVPPPILIEPGEPIDIRPEQAKPPTPPPLPPPPPPKVLVKKVSLIAVIGSIILAIIRKVFAK